MVCRMCKATIDRKADNILDFDPFAVLDREGVGAMMTWAIRAGRETRPNIKLGICGEHGGDPSSVEYCHQLGLNYVSCSPYRVAIARLSAAQAAVATLEGKTKKTDTAPSKKASSTRTVKGKLKVKAKPKAKAKPKVKLMGKTKTKSSAKTKRKSPAVSRLRRSSSRR